MARARRETPVQAAKISEPAVAAVFPRESRRPTKSTGVTISSQELKIFSWKLKCSWSKS